MIIAAAAVAFTLLMPTGPPAAAGQRIATANRTDATQGSWSQVRVSGHAPANATHATVLPYVTMANQGLSYVDDVACFAYLQTPSTRPASDRSHHVASFAPTGQ